MPRPLKTRIGASLIPYVRLWAPRAPVEPVDRASVLSPARLVANVRRNVILLSLAQALLLTNNVVFITLNGLAGYMLAADRSLATRSRRLSAPSSPHR